MNETFKTFENEFNKYFGRLNVLEHFYKTTDDEIYLLNKLDATYFPNDEIMSNTTDINQIMTEHVKLKHFKFVFKVEHYWDTKTDCERQNAQGPGNDSGHNDLQQEAYNNCIERVRKHEEGVNAENKAAKVAERENLVKSDKFKEFTVEPRALKEKVDKYFYFQYRQIIYFYLKYKITKEFTAFIKNNLQYLYECFTDDINNIPYKSPYNKINKIEDLNIRKIKYFQNKYLLPLLCGLYNWYDYKTDHNYLNYSIFDGRDSYQYLITVISYNLWSTRTNLQDLINNHDVIDPVDVIDFEDNNPKELLNALIAQREDLLNSNLADDNLLFEKCKKQRIFYETQTEKLNKFKSKFFKSIFKVEKNNCVKTHKPFISNKPEIINIMKENPEWHKLFFESLMFYLQKDPKNSNSWELLKLQPFQKYKNFINKLYITIDRDPNDGPPPKLDFTPAQSTINTESTPPDPAAISDATYIDPDDLKPNAPPAEEDIYQFLEVLNSDKESHKEPSGGKKKKTRRRHRLTKRKTMKKRRKTRKTKKYLR